MRQLIDADAEVGKTNMEGVIAQEIAAKSEHKVAELVMFELNKAPKTAYYSH